MGTSQPTEVIVVTNEIVIVQGRGFVVSDLNGNFGPRGTQGFFYSDTRYLSRLELLINGQVPRHLTARQVDPYSAVFVQTNPIEEGLPRDTLAIVRERFVGDGMHEDINLENYGLEPLAVRLSLSVDADFVGILQVRGGEIRSLAPVKMEKQEGIDLSFQMGEGESARSCLITFSEPPTSMDEKSAHWDVTLRPHGKMHICVEVRPVIGNVEVVPLFSCGSFGIPPPDSLLAGRYERREQAPVLESDSHDFDHTYRKSVEDLASLRFPVDGDLWVTAAGLPWFIAVFGRDSLITGIQTLLLGPEALLASLRTLARYQGKTVNEFREEQPGKILHEIRLGPLAARGDVPFARYYGTVDATPLFLIALRELYRWTGDLGLVQELLPNAEAALGWIDEFSDLDGDGFVEYPGFSEKGLANQGWKDSGDSIRFADGGIAQGPIALSEVQAYVYRAKKGMAELYEALDRSGEAAPLREQATALREQFHQAFWMEAEACYALALDGEKRQVDSVTSNAGQCLWGGIIEAKYAAPVVERMMADDMFSGWGIRTMSSKMSGYNPISYHNGTVWPHDNSLIAAGMAAYGFRTEATRVAEAILEVSRYFPDHRLPELFSGYSKGQPRFPVEYPTANSPQAWAEGSIPLLLQTVLGLEPDEERGLSADPVLPEGMTRAALSGVQVGGRRHDVIIRGHRLLAPSPQEAVIITPR